MSTQNNLPTFQYPMVTYNDGVSAKETSSAELQLLFQAISTCAVPLVHQLIQQNPKLIHERGWHGQTPLHKSCLIGEQTLCYLLLEAGADPNARNDFDETPLHYACKRGVPTIVHLLIQKGGNIDLIDKNGMNVCHHTAQTGSVYTLVYLYTLRSEYQQVNNQLQLPLHIACQFGHIDAFKFILRKERRDLKQADADGNNILHIAAREGHQVLCWDILKVAGCELLHEKNKEGYTPVDLVSQRDKFGHKVLLPILQDLQKHKAKNYMVTDPKWIWRWILLRPFTLYLLLIVFINLLTIKYEGYQGYIVTVGVVYLVWSLLNNIHRINHISRMPNPAFAGAFGAGLTHTTIQYFVHLLPYSKENMVLTAVSFLCMFGVYYIYYLLLTRNPGRVRQSMIDSETLKPMTIVDLCVPQKKMEEFCVVCEIVKPLRTKHCRLCEECFTEMDHHCLFLLKCIAKYNHVMFVWFLIACVFSMLLYLVHVYYYISAVTEGLGIMKTVTFIFFNDAWLFSLAFANIVSIIWGVNLINFQLQMVARGQLTALQKYTKIQSGLTANEKFWNVINFLMSKSPYAKDPVLVAQNLV